MPDLHAAALTHPRLERSIDRRLVAVERLARELREGGVTVVRSADVSARWSLDLDTASHVLDHLADEGLLGRRHDATYVARPPATVSV